jgi:putative FmdB family regulatory protein
MPLFEFECQHCGNVFELRIATASTPAVRCPACGSGQVERLWSPFSSPSGSNGGGCAAPKSGGFG